MRILIVSFLFAPASNIGSLRVTKLAEFLQSKGHSVKILCGRDTGYKETLSTKISESDITRTKWFNPNAFIRNCVNVLKGRKNNAANTLSSRGNDGKRRFIAKLYSSIVCIPDNHWGWVKPATRAGREIIDEFAPDLIITSGGPFSTFIAASKLARYGDLPWIADFRDLWSDNHAKPYLGFRAPIDRMLEKRALKSATYITSVSPLLVEKLEALHNKETCLVMNGFDPADYEQSGAEDIANKYLPPNTLNLVYTGTIYHDFQDIHLIMKAIAALPQDQQDKVCLNLFGRNHDSVEKIAQTYNVSASVICHGEIDLKDSIAVQQKADLLLFLLFHGPQAHGVFTGKLFEYIGANRPIIATGDYDNGNVCELIQNRNLGEIHISVDTLCNSLKSYIDTKFSSKDSISPPPAKSKESLTRADQFEHIETLISRIDC